MAEKCATYNDYYRNEAAGLSLLNHSIPAYSYYEHNVQKHLREDCWIQKVNERRCNLHLYAVDKTVNPREL